MHQIIKFDIANPLQIDWLHEAVIVLLGGTFSMLTLFVDIKIAEMILILTFSITLIEPLKNFIKLSVNKQLIAKLITIIKSEQLQDFTFFKSHCYPSNGIVIDVFENKKMYRLDFHTNGITHSDRVYHLDDRITESFQAMIINKKRHSWGMSYFVKK